MLPSVHITLATLEPGNKDKSGKIYVGSLGKFMIAFHRVYFTLLLGPCLGEEPPSTLWLDHHDISCLVSTVIRASNRSPKTVMTHWSRQRIKIDCSWVPTTVEKTKAVQQLVNSCQDKYFLTSLWTFHKIVLDLQELSGFPKLLKNRCYISSSYFTWLWLQLNTEWRNQSNQGATDVLRKFSLEFFTRRWFGQPHSSTFRLQFRAPSCCF